MADSDSESSWNDIIKDWTMVNRFGEVESDDHAELTSETNEDETGLLHSAPVHAGLQGSSMPCEEFQLEACGDGGAAAVTTADVGHETIAGASAEEENVSSEVTKEHEPEHRSDVTEDAVVEKVDELEPGFHDAQSLSSGSSIELLDVSDEGQDHSAIETPADQENSDGQKSIEVSGDFRKKDQREISGAGDGGEFTSAPDFVTSSSSSSCSSSAAASESSTNETGKVENVSATAELEVDRSRVAAYVMTSETTNQPGDDEGDDGGPVTEAERSDEQSQHDVEVQQCPGTSLSTGRTAGSELYDSSLNEAPSSVVEAELLDHADGLDQEDDDDAAAAAAFQLEKAESDENESVATEADMSIVSSVNSSDDIDMLPDAHVVDAVEAEAENIDDRCESDISGIVTDDSDLSSMSSGADIAMETGNVVYRHQPNPVFNTLLTCCTVLMLCFAVGIGVGHYFGSSTMPSLCEQQLHRLRSLQDEQYLCLSRLEQYEDKLQTMSDTEQKLSAVTSVWVRKYEELVKERARLEQSLNVSQQVNEKTLEMATDYHKKLNDSQAAVQFLAREVDRLSGELSAANESRHSSDLAAAEWKSKYETTQVELQELEQELLSTRAEANEAEQTLDMVQNDIARLTRDKTSSYNLVEALHDEVAELKNVVNQQKLEKAELESIILTQRYSEHPGNVVAQPSKNNRADVTQKIHRHDKDKTPMSQSTANASVDPSHDLSMEFVRLQQLLGRVARELDGESDLQQSSGGVIVDDRLNVSSDAVFITMLKYVMTSGKQSAGLDLATQMTSYSRALRRVTDCIEVLDNFTVDHQLAKTLMSPWNQFPRYMLLVEGNLSSQVIDAFKFCRQQFISVTNSKGDTGADPSSFVDDVFRQYMNRTLEIVSQLSHTVQTTLDRVKTLPEELFAENKTAKKIGRKMTEAVSKLNSKVQSGWRHVASKFEAVRKKWFGYIESKMCKQKKREEQIKREKNNGNDEKYRGKPFVELDEKVEDEKRSYKQTETAPTGKEDGQYGSQKHSDDLLHSSQLDDFFEDNHRAWQQHNNRRLRKIGERIERLNEEVFLSMDDDDIEDIYDDLKDVGEDIEEREKSDDLRTWMSCQLRWWKTRIHRKHRVEDLVKGCGRQLMHWQLRVLCKQQMQYKLASTLPYYHPCSAVMSPLKPKISHHKEQLPYDGPFNRLRFSQSAGSFEKIEDLMLKNMSCLDAGWYLRRVQDREDRRQLSPQWYFDRVEDRKFSRGDANWYVRAMRYNSAIYPVTDDGHRRLVDRAVKGDT